MPSFRLWYLAPLAITAVLAGTIIAATSTPASFSAQQPPSSDIPHITVSGEGEVRAEPDLAVISAGVVHQAPTAQEAMDEASRRMASVLQATRAAGVENRDIQTRGLSLNPVFRTPRPGNGPQEIEGYRATNSVTITVRDIASTSGVLDAVTNAGANQVGGVRFGLSRLEGLRHQALADAVANAESRARSIANAAGVQILQIFSVTEESISAPRPAAADFGVRAAPAEAPPVEPGEMSVRARVRVVFRI